MKITKPPKRLSHITFSTVQTFEIDVLLKSVNVRFFCVLSRRYILKRYQLSQCAVGSYCSCLAWRWRAQLLTDRILQHQRFVGWILFLFLFLQKNRNHAENFMRLLDDYRQHPTSKYERRIRYISRASLLNFKRFSGFECPSSKKWSKFECLSFLQA